MLPWRKESVLREETCKGLRYAGMWPRHRPMTYYHCIGNVQVFTDISYVTSCMFFVLEGASRSRGTAIVCVVVPTVTCV